MVAGLHGASAMFLDVLLRSCDLPPSGSGLVADDIVLLRAADQRGFGARFLASWHNSFLQRQDFVILLLLAGLAVSSEDGSSGLWFRATFSCLMSVVPVSRVVK